MQFCFTVPEFANDMDAALTRYNSLSFDKDDKGIGSISRVLAATCPTSRKRCFAAKLVPLPSGAHERCQVLQRVARESAVAQALAAQQPFPQGLVRHYACLYDPGADAVVLVMQLCEGPNLAELRRQQRESGGRLPEARVKHMARQVAAALGHMHGLGLLCVDLKAENVMLAPTEQDPDRVLLVDFDLCRDLPGSGSTTCTDMLARLDPATAGQTGGADSERVWGTAEYLAYELLQEGPSAYSPASDWWALGVLTYELLYGRPPYSAPTLDGVLHRITHHSPPFTPPEEGGPRVSGTMVQFIRALLRHRPEIRLGGRGGVEEVLSHPGLAQS
ncbi:hypothetical protein HYH02_013111 [Chlamydomonas schloesseri]|uniref:non-specific serine/threonine protein kinase n=1 Tax=Chlamydomonas schloesseri TaxID=2026947 RepID=A0A835W0X1_9CHLO|nr:hypothetical protein HYH02_013111 [Chlamydomonas schloesseri]|eukprot:KAG2432041.1 hypothetical protein HYH02_013111 [Chlamydomonas schloesseri]